MKKGSEIQGTIEKILFPNKGVMYVDDTQVRVKNAIPGQKISAVVKKKRGSHYDAQLIEVLERSGIEDAAETCPHAGVCGGCLYSGVRYEEEQRIKEQQVRELLESVMPEGKALPMLPLAGSPVRLGYRNKMEFSFGDEIKGGPLTLGLHKRGSFYDILTVDRCMIADRDFNLILRAVLDYMTEARIPFYKKMEKTGILRHLLVRKTYFTQEILVDLVTASGYEPEDSFVQLLLDLPLSGKLAGILHTTNDSIADIVADQGTAVLYGQPFITEKLLGLEFKITPFSFFQTNSAGAETLYSIVREFVGNTEGKVIYDLYSGTGTIAQILAPVAEKVIGVEIVPEAVEAARENAGMNALENCEFICGDVLKVLDDLTAAPDILILDPPRDGIHPKALPKLLGYHAGRIIYISCKPTSLQRDLPAFLASGYEVEKVKCVDMFPGTGNVETVVLLSHKDPDSHIHVKVEFGEGKGKVPLDKIAERAEKYKPKEKVTYKKIKEYIEDKFGFKVHTAYIAEVKRAYGLPMYDAPNAVEELKQPRKHPTEEKVKAISDALVHFGLIN